MIESVEKCESGWSKVQYVCDTIMLTLKDKVCYYSITHSYVCDTIMLLLCCYRTIVEWNKGICCMDRRRNNSYYAMTPEWFGR